MGAMSICNLINYLSHPGIKLSVGAAASSLTIANKTQIIHSSNSLISADSILKQVIDILLVTIFILVYLSKFSTQYVISFNPNPQWVNPRW